jgi:hypothetical protein
MEILKKWRNEDSEEMKKLPGEEAEKGGCRGKPYMNDIRFYL